MTLNLLLISTSKSRKHPGKFLAYCEREIKEHLGGVQKVLFIPYAEPGEMDPLVLDRRVKAGDRSREIPTSKERYQEYTEFMRPRFQSMGYELVGLHEKGDSWVAISEAEAIYVGGGHTVDLLRRLYEMQLVQPLKDRLNQGIPYIGVSAGSVIAGPNIGTTNDNPKPVESLDALRLVPFCIKPHYLDKLVVDEETRRRIGDISQEVLALIDHQGESHKDRIREFHHTSPHNVVGLREGALLKIVDDSVTILGANGLRVFRRERLVEEYMLPENYGPGQRLNFELREAA